MGSGRQWHLPNMQRRPGKIPFIRCQGLGIPPFRPLVCTPASLRPRHAAKLPSCTVCTRRESSWRAWLSLGSSFCLGGCLCPFRARAAVAATAASACVTRTDWLKLFEGLTGLDLALYRGTNKSVLRVQTTAYSVAVLCLASGSARNITKTWIYVWGGLVFWGMPVRMVCGCVGLRQYGNNDYCSLKIEKLFTDKLLGPSTTARLLPTRHGCRNRNSELFRALLH